MGSDLFIAIVLQHGMHAFDFLPEPIAFFQVSKYSGKQKNQLLQCNILRRAGAEDLNPSFTRFNL